jgi:hypothetical protein
VQSQTERYGPRRKSSLVSGSLQNRCATPVGTGNSLKCIGHSRSAKNLNPAGLQKREWNEPDMTIYPVEFHKRSDQRWARRARLSRASETMPGLRLVRPYCLSASKPERERLDGVPLSHTLLDRNASAYADRERSGRT